MKKRAIVVMFAGATICFIAGGLIVALEWVSGTHVLTSVSHAAQTNFYNKSLEGLLAIFACGIVALGNAVIMLKRGRPNQVLSIVMIGGFVAGAEMIREAASLLPS